jgi:hypothetical protein
MMALCGELARLAIGRRAFWVYSALLVALKIRETDVSGYRRGILEIPSLAPVAEWFLRNSLSLARTRLTLPGERAEGEGCRGRREMEFLFLYSLNSSGMRLV